MDIVIPKEGVRITFVDENGDNKFCIQLSAFDIQEMIRKHFGQYFYNNVIVPDEQNK